MAIPRTGTGRGNGEACLHVGDRDRCVVRGSAFRGAPHHEGVFAGRPSLGGCAGRPLPWGYAGRPLPRGLCRPLPPLGLCPPPLPLSGAVPAAPPLGGSAGRPSLGAVPAAPPWGLCRPPLPWGYAGRPLPHGEVLDPKGRASNHAPSSPGATRRVAGNGLAPPSRNRRRGPARGTRQTALSDTNVML